MPTIITKGSVSAIAYGFCGQTLKTEVFTANGTWVAPTGVTSVARLYGAGSPGVSDYSAYIGLQFYASRGLTTLPEAPYAQWSSVYSAYTSALGVLGSGYPKYFYGSIANLYVAVIAPDDTWVIQSNSTSSLDQKYVLGYTTGIYGSPSTSGNITYSSITQDGWYISVNYIAVGNAGTASTALGYTFPGGTYTGSYPNGVGNAAVPATYTNVPVTPGNSYSIVVPSGGQVQISYYT